MKKSEFRNLIREEIKKVMVESMDFPAAGGGISERKLKEIIALVDKKFGKKYTGIGIDQKPMEGSFSYITCFSMVSPTTKIPDDVNKYVESLGYRFEKQSTASKRSNGYRVKSIILKK